MSLIKVDASKVIAIKIAEAKSNRRAAYLEEADPLFFKAQRNEIPLEEWEKKIIEIRKRYPYPKELNSATN